MYMECYLTGIQCVHGVLGDLNMLCTQGISYLTEIWGVCGASAIWLNSVWSMHICLDVVLKIVCASKQRKWSCQNVRGNATLSRSRWMQHWGKKSKKDTFEGTNFSHFESVNLRNLGNIPD